MAVKDNICVKGKKTTCASRILADFVPQYNAEVTDRMEKAGMILIGKTNMDEFAMGSTTETSAFGITRNPWDPGHVPGGSSGGSCAAVAAGEAYLASAPIPAAPSASRARSAALRGSNPHTGPCQGTAWWRTLPRWIRSAPWERMRRTAPRFLR